MILRWVMSRMLSGRNQIQVHVGDNLPEVVVCIDDPRLLPALPQPPVKPVFGVDGVGGLAPSAPDPLLVSSRGWYGELVGNGGSTARA